MEGAKLYETLAKRQHVVWIAQLRTAHCPLNDYFYRFSIVNDPMCECKEGKETVEHFYSNAEDMREREIS